MFLTLYNKTKWLAPFSYFGAAIIGSDAWLLSPDIWSITIMVVCLIPLYTGFYAVYDGALALTISCLISGSSSVVMLYLQRNYDFFNVREATLIFVLCSFVGLLKFVTAPKDEPL